MENNPAMGRASRIIFMGTPVFAVASLEALIGSGRDIAAVVTRPDKPGGRGLSPMPSPVKSAALEHGIEVLEPVKIRDEEFAKKLSSLKPDFIVVVAYGRILPPSILGLAPCVNLHASLLPKYRGAAPINWAIINGEKVTGVSTMFMEQGLDTGPVLLEEKVPIEDDDTARTLSEKLSRTGARLLEKTIGLLAEGRINPVIQDDSLATYAPILKKEDGRIDWGKTPVEIRNLMRGVYPWPGAYTFWRGMTLKIHGGRPVNNLSTGGLTPGTVLEASNDGIKVLCSGGVFVITELQPENKKRMPAGDFLKGYRLGKGDRFES